MIELFADPFGESVEARAGLRSISEPAPPGPPGMIVAELHFRHGGSSMTTGQRERMAGVLFLMAGVAFYVAAGLAHQIPFYGAGTALVGVGVVFLAKARKSG